MQLLNTKSGVYVVRCQNFYKIGKADNLKMRVLELQVGCPYELTVSAFVPCDINKASELEQMLHRKYKEVHARGEWFKLRKSDISDITAINQDGLVSLTGALKADNDQLSYDKAILDIIRSLYKMNKIAFERMIIECAASIGINEPDAINTIKRLMGFGEIGEPYKGAFQPA